MPAGAPPATPTLASASSIRCQPHCQSSRTTRSPRVHPDALTFAIRQTDRSDPRRPTSSSHAPWLNPHSACGSAGAPPTAISCLGAFWTPAASVGGGARHRRRPKTCTGGDIDSLARCKSVESSANVDRGTGDTATGRASKLSQTASASRTRFVPSTSVTSPTDTLGKRESLREHRDINSTEAGRLSLAVMPKTTRYKHKEGRHLCTRIPR